MIKKAISIANAVYLLLLAVTVLILVWAQYDQMKINDIMMDMHENHVQLIQVLADIIGKMK